MAALAALRARLQGVAARDAVKHFVPDRMAGGGSARKVLQEIRSDLVQYARIRGRDDLGALITRSATAGAKGLPQLERAIDMLRTLPLAPPQIADEVDRWLPSRAAQSLRSAGIKTLADLTLRVPRSRTWYNAIPGLGPALAAQVETFFQSNPELTERARALVRRDEAGDIVPFERQQPRAQLDGSTGRNRAPAEHCLLAARNDYEAVQAWLSQFEASTTQRAYRKEAERVLLWAVVQLGKPLASLTSEDAIAYRAFLRDPTPAARWIGPHRKRTDPDWRPFTSKLTPHSTAYALKVVNGLFAWLVDQQYLRANPFSGVKVRGANRARVIDVDRSFTEAEWGLVRTITNDLERKHGWEPEAAHRARFLLDFSYGTGLRPGELIAVTLGQIGPDDRGIWWATIVGKGAKARTVVLPPIALTALGRYLDRRQISLNPLQWDPHAPMVANLAGEAPISATRLWAVMHKVFVTVAGACEQLPQPQVALALKLRRASPHWMRHTHASHALSRGTALVSVRDNLGHKSSSTTSTYLHSEDIRRAQELAQAFSD